MYNKMSITNLNNNILEKAYFFFGVPDKEIPHKHLTDALNTEDYDEKLKNLIAAYSNIKEQTGLSFDIEKVAKLEARMHNYYFNQKKYNECEILLVELYSEIFSVNKSDVREVSKLRNDVLKRIAMKSSDNNYEDPELDKQIKLVNEMLLQFCPNVSTNTMTNQ